MSRFAGLAAVPMAVALLVHGDARADPAPVSDAPDSTGVVNGDPAPACGWPTTVAFDAGGNICSGTLVHPEIVLTAAHCALPGEVTFGEDVAAVGQTVPIRYCRAHPMAPGYGVGGAWDAVFCRLDRPVHDLPTTPIIMGCEASMLGSGSPVTVVGFGRDESGSVGTKHVASSAVSSIGGNVLKLSGGGQGVCQGDSGGSSFFQLPDGSWRSVGITSQTYGGCGGASDHVPAWLLVDWIEEESGIDVTPCHDVDGTWNPSQACTGFATDPAAGGHEWASWCNGAERSGPGASCGDPAQPDEVAPEVRITSPQGGATFDEPVTVTVEIEASDEDSGVREVWMTVNGEPLGGDPPAADSEPPYGFELQFPLGTYALVAFARDHANNSGQSETVYLGVGEDAPEPPDPGGDETSDDDADGDDGDGDDGGTDGTDAGSSDTLPDPGADEVDDAGDGCSCNGRNDRGLIASGWALMLLAARRRITRAG